MPYITNSDILNWLGAQVTLQLTDDDASGLVNETRLEAARTAAEAEADSYLAARFRVPLDVTGDTALQNAMRAITLDLVAYRLHGRRPPVPGDVVRRREETVAWLMRIATGVAQLPAAVPPPANPALGLLAEVAGGRRIMTRDELEDT